MKKIARVLLFLFFSASAFGQEKKIVNADEFEKSLQTEGSILLDVRTPEEFAEAHIQNAININWQNSEEFKSKTTQLDKTKPVYIYCLAGVRSAKASDWLLKNGFANVTSLEGGIEAWKKAGKAVSAPVKDVE